VRADQRALARAVANLLDNAIRHAQDGGRVTVCVAIAARGDGHIEMLAALAEILLDPVRARRLREATCPTEIVAMLSAVGDQQ
jgi:PTS system mannitol-specific IIA component